MSEELEYVLSRLQQARRSGDGWMALCPAHRDKNPSLSIRETDINILLYCHAGCSIKAVCDAARIEMPLLFRNSRRAPGIVAEYPYEDETGALLYEVVRYVPKGFKQRRPDGNGGWNWKLHGARRILYRLRDVLAEESILVCEGEKDCDTARNLGLVATCNPGGAGKWWKEYAEPLRGKHVSVIADADQPGRNHAQQVAASLYGKVQSLKVLELPGAKDLSEWVEYGGTREQLTELSRNTPEWKPYLENPNAPRLRAVSAEELLSMEIPPREMVLAPILPSQGLAMLYSERGVGKTHVALGIACAVYTGGQFLRWSAPKPRGVLYVDGELPHRTMRDWLSATIASVGRDATEDPAPLHFLTPDLQDAPMPDLATTTGQAAIEPFLEGVELLIIDNLSALCRVGEENEGGDWVPIQSWILSLRRRGITVLLLHHAGKSGAQRGTSRREDSLDVVIKLKHPADYSPEEGLRAEIHFDKGRGLYGDDAKPFEVRLQTNAEGAAEWTMRSVEDATLTRACELYNEGQSVRDVAEALSISKSKAGRLRARWKASEHPA